MSSPRISLPRGQTDAPQIAQTVQPAHTARVALSLADELGRQRTLSSGPEAYTRLWDGQHHVLLLGLGPCPRVLAALLNTQPEGTQCAPVFIECPAFAAALGAAWRSCIPASWTEISPQQAIALAPSATLWWYPLNLRLFNDFWGPILAAMHAKRLGLAAAVRGTSPFSSSVSPSLALASSAFVSSSVSPTVPSLLPPSLPPSLPVPPSVASSLAVPPSDSSSLPPPLALPPQRPDAHCPRCVLLPGTDQSLLINELATAFEALGMQAVRLDPARMPAALPKLLHETRPELMLSVNGLGLDREGTSFHLLRTLGIDLAIWIVDNPWHVLSAWPHPWWRDAAVFVTDAAFIPGLRAHGAKRVWHVPLGAWMPQATPYNAPHAPLKPIVFVGSSAFPDKKTFFSGLRVPSNSQNEATALLEHDSPRPDFFWWLDQLGMSKDALWPGRTARLAGLGTENASASRRAAWLHAALPLGLTVFGDAGWAERLHKISPPACLDLRPPVDYYQSLPHIYAAARYSLNITSLLLPSGLTQRHFDVWSAGGFLLSDASPGLTLFPDALTEPITVRRPTELLAVINRLEKDPSLRQDLRIAWLDCLKRGHTLADRMRIILQTIDRSRETH